MTPLLFDVKAAAAACGVSGWTLRTWIDNGQLATVKVPSTRHPGEVSRRVLISAADLQDFIGRYRTGGAA